MIVFNIQRFSTEDGPGIRTSVFLKGCPLSCYWCHNPESISPKPQLVWYGVRCIAAMDCIDACNEDALKLTTGGMIIDREKCTFCGDCVDACPSNAFEIEGKNFTVEELYNEIIRDKAFFDNSEGGVTFSGGEPLMQHKELSQLIKMLKSEGFHIAIDTTAFAGQDVIDEIMPLVDLVLLDIKIFDEKLHREYTGVPLSPILKNAEYISNVIKKPIWVRTPIIPGYTDSVDSIKKITAFIKEKLPTVERYDLLAYNNTAKDKYQRLGMEYKLNDTPLMERKKMNRLFESQKCQVLKISFGRGM